MGSPKVSLPTLMTLLDNLYNYIKMELSQFKNETNLKAEQQILVVFDFNIQNKVPLLVRQYDQCTLLVLVNFCLVMSKFLTWRFVWWNFWYFYQKNCQWNSDQGLTFLLFEFLYMYIFAFDQQYWNTGLKTQNVEKFDFHWTIFARISKVSVKKSPG